MSTRALQSLIDEMESVLEDYLDEEIERVEGERDFLLAVLDGRADGVSVENTSSNLTETYLTTSLAKYIPIEDDDDG